MLREFASKRQVRLSRVTVRAKDEGEDVKPKSKHRRRRARASAAVGPGGGERKESSERSLAKVRRAPPWSCGCSLHLQPLIPPGLDHVPRTAFDKPPADPFSNAAHSLRFPSIQVMRQTEEELEPDAGPSSGPSAKHADTPSDADLEALLQPHGALVGRRAARQWRPALQSIAEG